MSRWFQRNFISQGSLSSLVCFERWVEERAGPGILHLAIAIHSPSRNIPNKSLLGVILRGCSSSYHTRTVFQEKRGLPSSYHTAWGSFDGDCRLPPLPWSGGQGRKSRPFLGIQKKRKGKTKSPLDPKQSKCVTEFYSFVKALLSLDY